MKLCEKRPSDPRNGRTMVSDQSALLELLVGTRSADGGDLIRRLFATILQLLVDAEATAFIRRGSARTH